MNIFNLGANSILRLTRSSIAARNFSEAFTRNSVVHLLDRSYIAVSGPDAVKYLQGMCTYNVTKFVQDASKFSMAPIAFLTAKVES